MCCMSGNGWCVHFTDAAVQVMKLFDHISEIAEDETVFVCVLIDEIESIASARQASVSSNEPSDAVRWDLWMCD